MRAGFELDAQQQTKLRTEAAVDRDLTRFRSILGKQLLAADAASGQEGIEANDDDEDDEVSADEAAAARLWPGDEDEDESHGVMGDGEDEGTEEQGSDVRVRMDRASRDAALVRCRSNAWNACLRRRPLATELNVWSAVVHRAGCARHQ